MARTHVFTRKQELGNAVSHGLGIAFSVVALLMLIYSTVVQGNMLHIVSGIIFGATMLLLYSCSTLLHSLPPGRAKDVFEVLDHSAIYLFIAGSYTPLLLIIVGGRESWILLSIIWIIAIGGIVFKAFFVKEYMLLSTIGYILLGWMAVFMIHPMLLKLPIPGLILLVAGGLFYTIGTVFYIWRKFTYHHTVWHLFVLAGSICHFILIYKYVLTIE
ncbi:MAG: hemolysin III family protein [Acidibacillus sp.]|nr:hemolysin III family protein [Acidibacillus sp.]